MILQLLCKLLYSHHSWYWTCLCLHGSVRRFTCIIPCTTIKANRIEYSKEREVLGLHVMDNTAVSECQLNSKTGPSYHANSVCSYSHLCFTVQHEVARLWGYKLARPCRSSSKHFRGAFQLNMCIGQPFHVQLEVCMVMLSWFVAPGLWLVWSLFTMAIATTIGEMRSAIFINWHCSWIPTWFLWKPWKANRSQITPLTFLR